MTHPQPTPPFAPAAAFARNRDTAPAYWTLGILGLVLVDHHLRYHLLLGIAGRATISKSVATSPGRTQRLHPSQAALRDGRPAWRGVPCGAR